jgi:hypothetical protein
MTSELGARIQLAAVGPQDVYTTAVASASGVSPWVAVFKRPTRFALETVDTPFANGFVLGRRNRTDIPRAGDCLGGITLEIRLPAIPGAAPGDTWVPSIGYALLRRVRVWLNDVVISDAERLWYDIHDRLFVTRGREALGAMIGARPLPLTQAHTLHVPLQLPFSPTNWFPTVALGAGTRMTLDIDAEAFAACIRPVPRVDAASGDLRRAVYIEPTAVRVVLAPSSVARVLRLWTADGQVAAQRTVPPDLTAVTLALSSSSPWSAATARCGAAVLPVVAETLGFPGRPAELDVRCLFETAFLDAPERFGILQARTLWSFDAALDMETKTYAETIGADGRAGRVARASAAIDLSELNHPVRALAWVVYDDDVPRFFEYHVDALESCRLWANNHELLPRLPGAHFQLLTKVARAGVVAPARDGVHFLSFAMHPGALQPSGSLGFDKAKQPFLEVAIAPAFRAKATIKVFALVRRVLAIARGTAAFVTL